MASIQRHGKAWRVQVFVDGRRLSKVLPTKQEAAGWALRAEAELAGRSLPAVTLAQALQRYAREVSATHRGQRWEAVRIRKLMRDPLALRRLDSLSAAELSAWRDRQLQVLAPSSVAREMTLLRSVFETARRDWHWLRVNAWREVRWPKAPPARRRRIAAAEVEAMTRALGLGDPLAADTASQRVGLAFLFALETAMRSGEIVGLRWADLDLAARTARLARTKNGDPREVPLSTRAVELLRLLPAGTGPVFGLSGAVRDALWRRARDAAGVVDLHFHDSRAEAIWRLSKRLDVLQLARVIGHRDPRSLMLYYHESAADMALRLG
jgi:integrase